MQIIFKKIPSSAIEKEPDRFNTTYHEYAELPEALKALEPERTASDLETILRSKLYSIFVPIIHSLRANPPEHHAYPLSHEDCQLLARIAHVSLSTHDRRVSEVHDVDLELLARRITRGVPGCFDGRRQWFARMDTGSPKNGRGGVGPFTSAREVLESICTSRRAYDYLKQSSSVPGATDVLHFLPWREDISTANEFRMFVPPSGQVRAISEYSTSGKWADMPEEELGLVVRKMLECHEAFREKAKEGNLLPESGYTIDLHCSTDDMGEWVVEALEVNMFGAQNGAGSCLFNWVEDGSWQKMYGLGDDLEVRILDSNT
ncbi:hypothetical protein JR316_0005372 [Psilocybe cubensis]|uniref:Cell division cycle protein 123 n=2 Tax=Psilocybe cubensis TaxID=181762 RepID=A0A8H7XKN1_PSICU|nr:hypothetical protein JR316_0005372 [Psilocybe cubensis]KAH9483268.1 hypothetical protein JR316_0005372 [Psilocybe cubensis]